MKYPRCQYYQQVYPYVKKRTCEAPSGRHVFDKGCKGHRTLCPSYVADVKPKHNICKNP